MRNNKIRLFIGIPLTENILSELLKFQSGYEKLKNIRWIPKENLHITTCFIGDTDENKLPDIVNIIENIISSQKAFSLDFNSICFAPKGKKAYMIWAKFLRNNDFEEIAFSLYKELTEEEPNRNKLIPHITLARFKRDFNKENINMNFNVSTKSMHADKIILWKSELKKSGAKYSIIREFYFNKKGCSKNEQPINK